MVCEENKNESSTEFVTFIQGTAEITPTFQRRITNKWYEISPKPFCFPNVDITKFFLL
jgi:hypothetical protein